MDLGEASSLKSSLDFRAAIVMNSPSRAMRVVENSLFDKDVGVEGLL